MFKKILIANRGEIVTRVARTCREMGIATVAIYSKADESSPHIYAADEAVCVGPGESVKSYLNSEAILAIARKTNADAVHPGYGFLSENGTFAGAVKDAGLTFIGPSPESLSTVGNKIIARRTVSELGVPVIPAIEDFSVASASLKSQVDAMGYPLLIKAAAGGGGKGMRIVREEADLLNAIKAAQREAEASFSDGNVYLERFLERPRHIEVQILGDGTGEVVHLGERECSIQRRYQKIIEETPSPAVSDSLRAEMVDAAIRVAKAANYHNAGTVEFIVEGDNFYFLEVNARLQVEHPITEWVTGMDLVREQIRIAAGETLNYCQQDVSWNGHAIECRLYAEDCSRNFRPSPGRVLVWRSPEGPGVRVDSGIESQTEVPVYYDPMIAKISTWGLTREKARTRMSRALEDTAIAGITTNLPYLSELIRHEAFVNSDTHTEFLPEHFMNWQNPTSTDILAAAFAAAVDDEAMVGPTGVKGTGPKQQDLWRELGPWRVSSGHQ